MSLSKEQLNASSKDATIETRASSNFLLRSRVGAD